jgi:hypothetical protein
MPRSLNKRAQQSKGWPWSRPSFLANIAEVTALWAEFPQKSAIAECCDRQCSQSLCGSLPLV